MRMALESEWDNGQVYQTETLRTKRHKQLSLSIISEEK